MHEYLSQHPDIFMCLPKEPYHFLTDMPHQFRYDYDAYMKLFREAGDQTYWGESSVWYLYSRAAAGEIWKYCSEAKIIIMLREPVGMLYSLHARSLHTVNEDIFDFAEALAAEPDRREGRRIPESSHFPAGLQYREVVDYAPQVERYFDTFGTENVHVILFDDLIKDTLGVFKRTLSFLGLPDCEVDLSKKNVAGPLPNLAIQRFLRRHLPLRRMIHQVIPNPIIEGIQAGIAVWTQKQRPRRPNPELRRQLEVEFRPGVERLARLIGRDLSHWYANSDD